MTIRRAGPKRKNLDEIVASARREKEAREKGYREQALKLYPWICGRCTREFTLKTLHELTVHHRNHNHDDNPQDGSNWELLCLYCHDEEHARYIHADSYGDNKKSSLITTTHSPFLGLGDLLKKGDG